MNYTCQIGRLTRDPEIKEKVARYTIAVDREYKKEGQPETDFFNCVVFGKGIDFVSKYLHKGMKIAIEGRLQSGSYTKEDGKKVYTFDIIVNKHEFCEKRSDSVGSSNLDDLSAQYPEFVQFEEVEDDGSLPF